MNNHYSEKVRLFKKNGDSHCSYGLIRLCISLMFLTLITTQVNAQLDKVILQNGSVLYGEVDQLDKNRVSIDIQGEKFSFPVKNIRLLKLSKESRNAESVDASVYDQLSKMEFRGFEKNVQLGFLHGKQYSGASADVSFSGSFQLSYRYHQYVQAGLSVGYDHFDQFGTFPVQFTYRGDLSSRWATIFYYGSVGYGFAKLLEKTDENPGLDRINGGIAYRAGLGYRWRLEKTGFEFAVGWKHQKVDYDYKYYGGFWAEDEDLATLQRSINRAEVKFGFIF